MTSPHHLVWFLALGLIWGMSPAIYKHLSVIGMPATHTIFVTGMGVGLVLWGIAALRGQGRIPIAIHRYGALCGFLLNMPFGIALFLAAHVPPTELAIIATTSPFYNYLLTVAMGWEQPNPRRLLAIAVGFTSTVVLILSREGMLSGQFSWWLLASFSVPALYCAYNVFAARAWPRGADVVQVGAAESVWSGLGILPVLLWLAPFGAAGQPSAVQYAFLIAVIAMWVVERIAYFTLIRNKGAVYTAQATYVATPAAVLIAGVFFGGTQDAWLWLSLAILMVALWLNNSGRALNPAATPQSS